MNSYTYRNNNYNNRYCCLGLLFLLLLVQTSSIQWRIEILLLLSGVSGFSSIIGSRCILSTTNDYDIRPLQPQQYQQPQQQKRLNKNKLFKLHDVLSTTNENVNNNNNNNNYNPDDEYQIELSDSLNVNNNVENDDDAIGGSHIPKDGYSVSDAITDAQKDRFVTTVVPIKGLYGVAQLVTSSTFYQETFEPVRYLVSLVPPPESDISSGSTSESTTTKSSSSSTSTTKQYYVLVDVPPYSTRLVNDIEDYIGTDGTIIAMVITNKDSIHYDDATGSVFSIRQNDISDWKKQYPTMSIIGYRLDIPRNCRNIMTQILDGYGPFATDITTLRNTNNNKNHKPFIETGRPLTYQEWDTSIANDVLSGNLSPDYDNNNNDNEGTKTTTSENDLYTPEAIRQREVGKHIIAVYTPGHTFGSVSYIFPYQGICCSGYVLPIEDNRVDYNDNDEDRARISNQGMGPIFDCRGYITTNQVGITRQMETARNLINTYIDRFHIILPARGDPLFLENSSSNDDNNESESIGRRKETILQILSQYEKIGTIYEQLGIVSSSSSSE